MRWTLQTRLRAIVGIAAFAFLLLLVVGSYTFFHVDSELRALEKQYLPKIELAPKLESDFERLNRKFEDAVQAQEPESLHDARKIHDQFISRLDNSGAAYLPENVQALRSAFADYYRAAEEVSRRLIAGETGEGIVSRMENMQSRRARAALLLERTTAFNRAELERAFGAVRDVQRDAAALRIAIAGICMALVLLLSWGMSRGVFRVLSDITSGLERFGRGDLAARIPITSADELSVVAERANQMAGNLDRIRKERDRIDWLRNGHAALSKEVRGELDPAEVGRRAIACLARYLEAPAAALYQADDRRTLHLVAEHAGTAMPPGAESATFRFGEGLVGQAALREELTVIEDPPENYFRIRSAFGQAAPSTVVLLPLVHAGRVTGVVEFAMFRPWSELSSELLLSVRESLAIALEVARARAFLRTLLAEAQEFTRRLTAQEERLRATNEELESQQEVLRHTNEELSIQAKELHAQRAALEERNVELTDARASLEQKAQELESVSAYKSQFLANMSHELRTPLNSMILLSSLLAENESGNLTPKQVEFCSTVHAAGRDLLALINQVLDLAKVEAGKQDVNVGPIDLRAVAAHARGIFGPLAAARGLTLEVEVAPDAPVALVSDRQRLEQILNNLLGNAVKFTEHGRVTLRIQRPPESISVERMGLRRDESIAFVVSDTGRGIAPAEHERMFAPFEQGEGATDRRFGGTGLGLTIARSLTSLLGGELVLESAPGRGSTFTCCLPLAFSASHPSPLPTGVPATTPSAALVPDDRGAVEAKDECVLVIEDDPVFSRAFGDVVRAQGLKFVHARNGRAGMALAKQYRPRGIVLDVALPQLDGWAAMNELRADPATASIPVHFVSASRGGAVGYLTKPASRMDFLRVIEAVVPAGRCAPVRALVLDANPESGESLTRLLESENLRTTHVPSARDAVNELGAGPFACVVIDLSSLETDGLGWLEKIEHFEGGDRPAIILYTARAPSHGEMRHLERYADAVIPPAAAPVERWVEEIRTFARGLPGGVSPRRQGRTLHPADFQLRGRSVLIVDDDMRTVYALSAILRAKGSEVRVADTGRAALAALAESPDVDAVLMDIMMPEMDGYEAMRRIRAESRFASLPILALTANAMKDDEAKCVAAGADAYLSKPIDADKLLATLHSYLVEPPHDEEERTR